ncbi:MAG: carbon storage regulator [Planctomycetota bacterium]|nr:MAG: carbon storage regulator [Planctomycetota bacterium]
MLVLTRKVDEAIHIGNDVVVRVLGVEKNGQVKLGISAPRQLRILREELLGQISAANRAALASGQGGLDLDFLSTMVQREAPPAGDDTKH